jgi:hypothetical protein
MLCSGERKEREGESGQLDWLRTHVLGGGRPMQGRTRVAWRRRFVWCRRVYHGGTHACSLLCFEIHMHAGGTCASVFPERERERERERDPVLVSCGDFLWTFMKVYIFLTHFYSKDQSCVSYLV